MATIFNADFLKARDFRPRIFSYRKFRNPSDTVIITKLKPCTYIFYFFIQHLEEIHLTRGYFSEKSGNNQISARILVETGMKKIKTFKGCSRRMQGLHRSRMSIN
jgi:hypothetical protein